MPRWLTWALAAWIDFGLFGEYLLLLNALILSLGQVWRPVPPVTLAMGIACVLSWAILYGARRLLRWRWTPRGDPAWLEVGEPWLAALLVNMGNAGLFAFPLWLEYKLAGAEKMAENALLFGYMGGAGTALEWLFLARFHATRLWPRSIMPTVPSVSPSIVAAPAPAPSVPLPVAAPAALLPSAPGSDAFVAGHVLLGLAAACWVLWAWFLDRPPDQLLAAEGAAVVAGAMLARLPPVDRAVAVLALLLGGAAWAADRHGFGPLPAYASAVAALALLGRLPRPLLHRPHAAGTALGCWAVGACGVSSVLLWGIGGNPGYQLPLLWLWMSISFWPGLEFEALVKKAGQAGPHSLANRRLGVMLGTFLLPWLALCGGVVLQALTNDPVLEMVTKTPSPSLVPHVGAGDHGPRRHQRPASAGGAADRRASHARNAVVKARRPGYGDDAFNIPYRVCMVRCYSPSP